MSKFNANFSENFLIKTFLQMDSHLVQGLTDDRSVYLTYAKTGTKRILDLTCLSLSLNKVLALVENVYSRGGRALIISPNYYNFSPEFRSLCDLFEGEDWGEGSISNFYSIKQMSNFYKSNLPVSTTDPSAYEKKNKDKEEKTYDFFKKYQSMGELKKRPRLLICLFPYKNQYKILFNEARLLDIPVICLTDSLSLDHNIDYPILCNVHEPFFAAFFLRLLEIFFTKGHLNYFSKYKIKKIIKYVN